MTTPTKTEALRVAELITRVVSVLALGLASWTVYTVNQNENAIVELTGTVEAVATSVVKHATSADQHMPLAKKLETFQSVINADKHEAWALRLADESRMDRKEIKAELQMIVALLLERRN